MPNELLSNPIDVLLAESEALGEIERVQRERLMMEEEYLTRLQNLRGSIESGHPGLSTTQLSKVMVEKIDKDVDSQQDFVLEMKDRLDKVPKSDAWKELLRLVNVMRQEETIHENARQEAEKQINPEEFWQRVAHPLSWCDLRLPPADIRYRVAVNSLNDAKSQALTFYQNRQHELRPFHTKRMKALADLISPGELGSLLTRDDTLTPEHVNIALPSDSPVSPTSISDTPFSGNIRGSFGPVPYINYLNHSKQGFPIFGLSIDPMGLWMTRLILRKNTEAHSPPKFIFTSADTNAHAMVKAAFKLESSWNYDELQHLEHAFERLGGGRNKQLERGWILGFLLVNLPRPIIGFSDVISRSPTRGMHSQEIVHVMPEETELDILRRIWRHTDLKNIVEGACALTQKKGTERPVSDIRRKWNMDTNQPVPAHMKQPSDDEGIFRRLAIKRASTSSGSDHHHRISN